MIFSNYLPKTTEKLNNSIILANKVGSDDTVKKVLYCNSDYNVYANTTMTNTDNEYVFDDVDPLVVLVYNKDDTVLLYTNQDIKYNSDSAKYEIYGYFPTTLKNCNATITESGWQTLQLDTPLLFN